MPAVLERLCRTAYLPRSVNEIDADRAIYRAAHRLAKGGLGNTCLTRSLGLAALLADQEGVYLHLGFRPSEEPEVALKGHAWVSVGNRIVPDESATRVDGEPCAEVAKLPARRGFGSSGQ